MRQYSEPNYSAILAIDSCLFYFSRLIFLQNFYQSNADPSLSRSLSAVASVTRLPLCVLARADTFTLAGAEGVAEGGVVVGGRLLDHDNYCISGTRAWYCKQAWNRWAVAAQSSCDCERLCSSMLHYSLTSFGCVCMTCIQKVFLIYFD